MRNSTITMIAVFLITLFPFTNSPAFAQTVVVPNSLENTPGLISNIFPLNCGQLPSIPSMRYQQVYLGSQFDVTGLIDKISFRLRIFQSPVPGFGPTILPNVLIELSTTQVQPGALSSIFADNIGPDVQTVFSGDLSLSAPDCDTQPCPFDVMIPLENPFFYDPQGGNLLFDIRIPVCVRLNPAANVFFNASDFPTIISRAFSRDVNSNVAEDVATRGLVTEFMISPTPPSPIATNIPTISEWGLIITAGILGIIGFIVIRRRKMRA
jgi:hypothetical protein